jgi:hypothetical protein
MKILDRLIGSLRGCCHSLPDLRQGGDTRYTIADIGLSAFSLFFLQSPSFLAHQRRLEAGQGRSNCQTLFGLDRVPSDNHIRALLDPVSPDHFHPVFTEVVAELEGSGGLEPFRFPIKLPRSTGSTATQFQSHLELLLAEGGIPPSLALSRVGPAKEIKCFYSRGRLLMPAAGGAGLGSRRYAPPPGCSVPR